MLEKIDRIDFQENVLVWVQFTDKGDNVDFYINNPQLYLTDRAIHRRIIKSENENLVNETDVPVNYEYIDDLQKNGFEIKNKSKWFNSVSLKLSKSEIYEIARKEYVRKIDLVRTFKSYDTGKIQFQDKSEAGGNPDFNYSTQFNYGASYLQNQMINVPVCHDSGYFGQDVLIACFDSGFDNLEHPTFDSVMSRGVRTYDFVNGDTIVANVPGHMGNGSHGTRVLSLIVGYTPGELISPAFRSKVILAKTENTESETPIEEDNWIAAAEWADSLGADIISSSLGYLDMDPGSPWSYDWTWMSGDSCLITKGANIAAQNGILVVNSAGNNGYNEFRNTLLAPADGFKVLTVGALNTLGERAGYSSVGPTVDGRIKPDIMAMGSSNVTAQSGSGNTGFTSIGSGTSFACPMVSGVAALILSANPNLNPTQLMQIIRASGNNTANPDRFVGWGTLNAWTAIQMALNQSSIEPINSEIPDGFQLYQNFPNPFNPVTNITFDVPVNTFVTLSVFDPAGRQVAELINLYLRAGSYIVPFEADDLSSGVYFYRLSTADYSFVKAMVLVK